MVLPVCLLLLPFVASRLIPNVCMDSTLFSVAPTTRALFAASFVSGLAAILQSEAAVGGCCAAILSLVWRMGCAGCSSVFAPCAFARMLDIPPPRLIEFCTGPLPVYLTHIVLQLDAGCPIHLVKVLVRLLFSGGGAPECSCTRFPTHIMAPTPQVLIKSRPDVPFVSPCSQMWISFCL
ncbi:unnamed protein product [Calypogeia fissa]